MIINFKIFENNNEDNIKRGDMVGCNDRVTLVVSDMYMVDGKNGFDLYYRSWSGDILHEEIDDIETCTTDDYEQNLWAYINIAKSNNYIINIPEYLKDDYPKEYEETQIRNKAIEFNI